MTRLRSLIKEVLSQPKKKDCGCGCNDCGGKAPILTEGKVKHLISEGLQYHIDKKISLFESIYRIGSEKHLELIREARALWIRGIIEVSDDDKGLLETHLGHFGLYEGVEVPLDLPMVDEGFYSSPSDLEDSGLNVTPKDQIHFNKLKDALEVSSLYAEENEATSGREGYFFFPEEEDGYDQLEMEIQELMDDYNIQGYIEGVFEESLNEAKFNKDEVWIWKHTDGDKEIKIIDIRSNGDIIGRITGTSDDFIVREPNKWLKKKISESLSLEERINTILEAKKKKKKDPPLNKPKRGGSKAYYVYVRDPKTKKIKKVSFGSGGLRAKIKNKEARNAFAARHNCKNKKDRTKAGYWSCNLPRYADQLGLGSKMNTFW